MKKLLLLGLLFLALLKPETSSATLNGAFTLSDSTSTGFVINFTFPDTMKYFQIYWIKKGSYSTGTDTTVNLPLRVTYIKNKQVSVTIKNTIPGDTLYLRVKAYSAGKILRDSTWIKTIYTPKLANTNYFTREPTCLTEYIVRGDALLYWIGGNQDSTKVYYKKYSASSYTLLGTYVSPTGMATLTGLVTGEKYMWYAATRGKDGNFYNSTVKTFNVPLPTNR